MKSKSFLPRIVIELSLQLANVRKLNESELPVLAILFDLKGHPQSQLTALAQRFDLRVVALALGLLRRMDLEAINSAANEVASYVCSRAGATPSLPDSLRELIIQPHAEATAPVAGACGSARPGSA